MGTGALKLVLRDKNKKETILDWEKSWGIIYD